MTDITANVVVSMPSQLFTMARSFKAVANGKIYIGKIDTDPVNPENQIQVYVENEDGSHIPVAQPIIINVAGYPVYNGQIAKFVTVQGHSMAVYDAYGTQQFYFPNVLKYDPDQLRQNLLDRPLTIRNGKLALADFINVRDYGIMGDGTDESSLWAAMIAALPSGCTTLYVPAGNYVCNTPIALVWAKLPTLIVDSEAILTPAISFSAFLNVQYRRRDETKFGAGIVSAGTTANMGGFKVGGGALMDSGDGMFLSSDGHANWMRIQTSKNYNPSEVAIYGSAAQGQLVHQSQNVLIRESGSLFDITNWAVGDAIYAFDRALVITALTSADQISVTEIGGGNLTAAIGAHSRYHYVYTTGGGICDVVNGVCTRKSGDPFFFFGYGNGTYKFWLNGTLRTVVSISNKGNTCTLQDTSINATNAQYKMRDDINSQISTLRVQKTTGVDEENLTISAKAVGEYEIRAGISGDGKYYPIRFYNGDDGAYKPHKVMEITPSGLVGIMNDGSSPSALLYASNKTNAPMSDGTMFKLGSFRTQYKDGARELQFGCLSNSGSNGGFIQGSDASGNNYQVVINPRGGNVGVNTDNPVFPLDINGACGPHISNTYTNGDSTRLWKLVYSVGGVLTTSDERKKTKLKKFTENEIAAAQELALCSGTFMWLKDCEEMGDDSPINIGYIVQDVIKVMEKHGLNYRKYKMIDHDEVNDAYALNYDQIIVFVMAGIVARLASG
ncbi:TPA: phage tailspike protein [Escherichia coli]